MNQAANPKTWEWLARLASESAQPGIDDVRPAASAFRSRASHATADSFVARKPVVAQAAPGDSQPNADASSGTAPSELSQAATNEHRSASASRDQAQDDVPWQVDHRLLLTVRDDTYFRADESEAWFHLFKILKGAASADLERAAMGPVSYVQLFRQAKEYRGRLVRLSGTVRRAHRLTAPQNQIGLARYWQLWLNLEDGSNSPVVVYAIDMPAGFPEGMDLHEPISLTAFSYKRWAYQSASGTMVAPVILAKSAQRTTLARHDRASPPETSIGTLVLMAATIGLGIAILARLAGGLWRRRGHSDERARLEFSVRMPRNQNEPTVGEHLKALESRATDSPENQA
jgi:hypothetical protein